MLPILLFLFCTIVKRNFAEIVRIDQGLVNGTVLHSRNGTPYQAFYAIPYAKPPVGDLRFQPPAEAPSWTGVRQSQTKGPKCIQSNSFGFNGRMVGTEDCLYLSVFTRETTGALYLKSMASYGSCEFLQKHIANAIENASVSSNNKKDTRADKNRSAVKSSDNEKEIYRHDDKLLFSENVKRDQEIIQPKNPVPVMVYIHGGAFCSGGGDGNDVHPLMDKPIVVVTINYRVGIFGFFSSNDESIPGNFGLKDQTAALRWVQKNIKYFGGNPQSVTIFGQSAGSVSVHLHLMSPLSKGLFHRAIMESGSGRSLWAYYNKHHSIKAYEDTIKRTNCNATSSLENLKCLQALPAKDIWQIEQDIKLEEILVLKYRPVIENATSQPGAFLMGDPHTVSYQDPSIPIIMGFNSAEGILDTIPILLLSKNMTVLDERLGEIIPRRLHYYYTTSHEKQTNITKTIKKFYFTNGVMAKGQEQELCNIMSDFLFIMPIIDAVISYPGPKYTYLYDYRNAVSLASMFNISLQDLGLQGACHADELLDLFYYTKLSPLLSQADIEFSKTFVTYWTNFAYSGNPNKHDNVPAYWQAAKTDPLHYLYINNTLFTMETGPLTDRHKFWLKCPLSHQYGKYK